MDTKETRRAGMAAFRAKMLKSHEAMLAGGDPNTLKRGATGEAARKYHAHMIETIKAAQAKYREIQAHLAPAAPRAFRGKELKMLLVFIACCVSGWVLSRPIVHAFVKQGETMKTSKPNPRRAELRALQQKLKPLVKAGVYPSMNAAIVAMYIAETGATEWQTFAEWRRLGRPVSKGERGFPIWGQPRRMAGGAVTDGMAAMAAVTGTPLDEMGREFFPVAYLFHAGQVEADGGDVYADRVRALEAEGLTTSDAQAAIDAEELQAA